MQRYGAGPNNLLDLALRVSVVEGICTPLATTTTFSELERATSFSMLVEVEIG
jgi:hypothetical protein